jgi:DNA polymerase-3 subunit delta'
VAKSTSSTGKLQFALLHTDDEEHPFEQWFVTWLGRHSSKKEMLDSRSDSLGEKIAGLGRETQKKFLQFCIEMFRQVNDELRD